MNMKHATELGLLENCPMVGSEPVNLIAYRFVFGGANHEKNFTCPSKLNPRRTFKSDVQCASLALSFYTSKDLAISAYKDLSKVMSNIRKTLGDSIAELKVIEEDGLASPADGTGHFDLWESTAVNFGGRESKVEAIAS